MNKAGRVLVVLGLLAAVQAAIWLFNQLIMID
jgi:hypothetical protein